MIKQPLIFFFVIIICCWSLPCEGWWNHEEFPPADPTSVVAEIFFSGGGMSTGQGYSGLGERTFMHTWITCPWDGSNCPPYISNNYSYHTKILYNIKPGGVIEPYLLVNASGHGQCNSFANRAVLDYTYIMTSNVPNAPRSQYIRVHVHSNIDLSMTVNCTPNPATYDCYYEASAELYIYDPEDIVAPPLVSDGYVEITEKDYPLDKKSKGFIISRLILPYQFRNVRLVTKCDIQSIIYRDGSFRRDGCIVSIDPIITIDPDQIVEIDGVEYPANEVYEIEYSEALLDLPGPESQPHIPLLLLDD